MKNEETKTDYVKVWNAYLTAWKTEGCQGRITAHELCMYLFVHIILLILVCGLLLILSTGMKAKNAQVVVILCVWVALLSSLRIVVPAVVRRLHDTGRSGRSLLIVLGACGLTGIVLASSPHYLVQVVVGYSIILVTLCLVFHFVYILAQKGQSGYNQYGPEPHDGAENNVTK